MVHHGNAIISSGSPLHEFAQWHKPADRATQSWGKCRNTQTGKRGEVCVCAFLLSEGCTVPPGGQSPPLQPHGQTRLKSSSVFRPANCSILLFPYLTEETALSEKGKMGKRHQQREKKKVAPLTSSRLVSCCQTDELHISKTDLRPRNGFFSLPDTPFSPYFHIL